MGPSLGMGGLPDRGRLPSPGPLPSSRTSALAFRTRWSTTPDLPWRPWTWGRTRRPARVWSWAGAARNLGGDKRVVRGERAKQLGAEQYGTKFLVPNQQLLKQLADGPTYSLDNIPRDSEGSFYYFHILPRATQRVPRQHSNLLLSGAGRLVSHLHHLVPQPASSACGSGWLHLQLPVWSATQPAGSNENLRLPA